MAKPVATRLGDVVNFKRGYDLPESARRPGPYPVISSAGISGYHDEYKVRGEGVVTGRYGTLGEMHYHNGEYWPHNTALYVTDFKKNVPKYVYYLLSCLGRMDTGDKSTVPGVNRNDLHELKIPFISEKSVQKKIAAVLSKIDTKIELNNCINAELEAMGKAIYDYWFVQFDFPDVRGRPYKSSGGKMVWNETLKQEIPAGWEVSGIGKWIDFQRGVSYRSSEIGESGVPLINLNSFRLDGSVKLDGTKMFSGGFREDQRVIPGKLVIAITDVTRNADIIGRAFAVPDLFGEHPLISSDVAVVETGAFQSVYYLEKLFNSNHYHRYIKPFAAGTLVLHLNLDGVRWFQTYLPPIGLLNRFDEISAQIRDKINASLRENIELTQLRDWLLPLLVSGHVRAA